MIKVIRLKYGTPLAIQVWRFVFYLRKAMHPSLNFGGVVMDFKGKRVVATHLTGRVCFLTDSQISNAGISHD